MKRQHAIVVEIVNTVPRFSGAYSDDNPFMNLVKVTVNRKVLEICLQS